MFETSLKKMICINIEWFCKTLFEEEIYVQIKYVVANLFEEDN